MLGAWAVEKGKLHVAYDWAWGLRPGAGTWALAAWDLGPGAQALGPGALGPAP